MGTRGFFLGGKAAGA